MNQENKKLPPIQGLWIGQKLGPIEQLSMKSFMAYGHPYHLYTYEEVEGVPTGVEIKDGNEILPAENIFLGKSRGYTPFSDWFRWELMQKKGGIYMDTDIIALRNLDLQNPIIMCYEHPTMICPAILKIPPEHPLVQKMINRCRNPRQPFLTYLKVVFDKGFNQHPKGTSIGIRSKIYLQKSKALIYYIAKLILTYIPNLSKYGSKEYQRYALDGELAGPRALTLNFNENKLSFSEIKQLSESEIEDLKKSILPTEAFFPVPWKKFQTLLNDSDKDLDIEDMFPDSYCIHLWSYLIRRYSQGISPYSYIAKLAQKYNVKIN